MALSFNPYAFILIFFGMATCILSGFIYKRGGNAFKWFILMMLSNAIWSIPYGLELASTSLKQIKFFICLEYIGIGTLPICWFIFCLNFCGKEAWLEKRRNVILLVAFPIITLLMVWTNAYHHLHYKQIVIGTTGPFPIANTEPGVWYFIFTLYFYSLLTFGCYLIFIKFKNADPIFQKQNYAIVIAILIPWLTNFTFLLGFKPLGEIDGTPYAFMVTTSLILLGIYRFKLFDILPIAREKVLELMQDGFFVLDQQHRIIDYNKSTLKYIHLPTGKKLNGSNLEELFPNQHTFFDRIKKHESGKIELDIILNGNHIYLIADILFLNDNKINNDFSIIKLQDLTTFKKDAIKAAEQANELNRLNQLKDRIFSIIAHDLRAPLVNISEILKMVGNNQITIDEFKAIAPNFNKDIIYTTELLENILHWSRSQLIGFGIKKEPFNLKNLIINEINYHLPAANFKKVKINYGSFPAEMVYADIIMVQMVIRNLISNGIKYCHQNCEIDIQTSYLKHNQLLIMIKDNGIGISQPIFEKLFKDENISTRGTLNEKGTGLGLLICKDFMERNNGSIHVESTEGKGTICSLLLPTHKEKVN
ncbi:sensor histidine kinase [Pedobacter insulae]|uniref:histidine kinase n=1 Tax=Pedobacter insulae TaxID=414048 RepID=A0A1I2VQQ5_9SPHI|nr:histidine kinase N-terminal 7TM domain-containing protein [Pedobacter insulae]SFG91480.1 Signal transduction histidine kinase [Pedobacter insulae]